MNIETVNDLIQSLESAGELSIKERKYLELAKEFKQLAAENVALKNPDNWLSQSDYGYEAAEVATQNGASEGESLRAGMCAIINRIATPATDRIVAGIKADGVEEFAEKLRIPGDDPFMDSVADGVAGTADSYAKQLREGADK